MAETASPSLVPMDKSLIEVRSANDWDIVGGRCTSCGATFHPFRRYCAACCREAVERVAFSKEGVITTATTVYQVLPNVFPEPPYVLASIALPERVTVKTVNAKGVDISKMTIGSKVTIELATVDENDGVARVAYVARPA